MAGGNHATTMADVAAKEIADGNRVACNKSKIKIELVRQLSTAGATAVRLRCVACNS